MKEFRDKIKELKLQRTNSKVVELLEYYETINGVKLNRCKITGKHIIWFDTMFRVNKANELIIIGKSALSSKVVGETTYTLQISEDGFHEHYKDDQPKNIKRMYNSMNKFTIFSYSISEEDTNTQKEKTKITLSNLTRKYGTEEGVKRFKIYCDKQAKSNSLEYKKEKHGWTEEEFKKFNNSRAVTLENQIAKHGTVEGTKRFESYCKVQSETSSDEYILKTYGEDKLKYVIEARKRSYDYFYSMLKCHDAALKAHEEMCRKHVKSMVQVSEISLDMIDDVLTEFKELTNNKYGRNEHGFYDKDNKKYYSYDFTSMDFNFVIEFHGDLFHGNPSLYKATDTPNFYKRTRTCQDMWDDDALKQKLAEEYGFKYFAIWEHDYKNNKEQALETLFNQIREIIK